MELRSGKKKLETPRTHSQEISIIIDTSIHRSPYRDENHIVFDTSESESLEMDLDGAWGANSEENPMGRPNETPQSTESFNSPYIWRNYTEEMVRTMILGPQRPLTVTTTAPIMTPVPTLAGTYTSSAPIATPSVQVPRTSSAAFTTPAANSAIPNASNTLPSDGRRSGFPVLEPNVENLLVNLMRKLDTGFSNINENLRNMNFGLSVITNPNQQPGTSRQSASPRNLLSSHTVEPPVVNIQPQSQPVPQDTAVNPPNLNVPNANNDPIGRLERIVFGLATQVQTLHDRMATTSQPVQSGPSEIRQIPSSTHSNISSYKTWPHKWKLKYDGDNNKLAVEFFWNQLIMLKETNDVMWTDVLCSFPNFLEGAAHKWFFRYWRTQPSLRWEKLKDDMIAHFRGDDSDESLWCKIAKRKQEDRESFDKFYDSVLDLQDRLGKRLSDKELIGILQENLRKDIQICLFSYSTESLTDFANKCRYIDKKLHPHFYYPGFNYTRRVSEIDREFPAEEVAPEIEAFASKRPVHPNSQQSFKCWNCDKVGHNFVMCEETRNRFCYWCGYKNVTCRSCPSCASNFRLPTKVMEPPPTAPPAED